MSVVNTGVQAHFKCVAVNENNESRNLTEWFPNLVLDSGLNRMSQGAWFTQVAVGTGSSEPNVSQTGLDSLLASTSTIFEVGTSRQTVTSPFYYSIVTVFRFAQGAINGNISEIAITWGGNNCWNRALIKDINGSPTTITVLENEFLDVYTELRIYPKMTDTLSIVNLLDGKGTTISTHEVTVRANMYKDIVNTTSATRTGATAVRIGDSISSRTNMVSVYGSNAQLNQITTNASGTSTGNYTPVAANDSYPTLRSCALKTPLAITQLIGVHKVVGVQTRLGDWKLEYNPPITKDNTQTLEHNFVMTWGRYEST